MRTLLFWLCLTAPALAASTTTTTLPVGPLANPAGWTDADIQTMYFTPDSKGRWLWTNSASITDVDKIFRQGPLVKAALLARPFSSLEIK